MFKLQPQGLRPRTPKSLHAADSATLPGRGSLRKTPEPLLVGASVRVGLLGRRDRASGTTAAEAPVQLTCPVSSGGEPSAGMPAEALAWRLCGGAGGTPSRVRDSRIRTVHQAVTRER